MFFVLLEKVIDFNMQDVAMFAFCWEDSSESEISQHHCLPHFVITHHLYLHTFISLLYYNLCTSEDIW